MFRFGYFFGFHVPKTTPTFTKFLGLFISQVLRWIWGGIHEPPRKKERKGGKKINSTPPHWKSSKLDTTWSVGLLLWGTQFYSLLPMLKSSCTLNPKNPLYFIRLWIVLCFTQGGHLLCSGIKAGFLQWMCLPSTWGVRALSFPPSHVHSHLKVRRKQSECHVPQVSISFNVLLLKNKHGVPFWLYRLLVQLNH
jgi:hypothetical protein